jgi:predicted PurR-regulated permease PerM
LAAAPACVALSNALSAEKDGLSMKPTSPRSRIGDVFYARTFALLTLLVLGFLVYRILLLFFEPLAWAAFIGLLLYPMHRWLTRKLHGHANVSAFGLTLLAVVFVLGPLTALGAAFVVQAVQLLDFVQQFVSAHGHDTSSSLASVPALGGILTWLQQTLGISPAQIQAWAEAGAKSSLQLLGPVGGGLFLGAMSKVMAFMLTLFTLFFVIRDGRRMLATVNELIPMSAADKHRLFAHIAAVIRAVVFGTGVTALVQGVLVGIGFAIAGLPSPVVFGVLAALFALLPFAGTPVVWLPAVIVLALQQRWFAAIFLLVWGTLLVATIDNVLRPYLVSGRAHVGTLSVFIGALGGISAFGAVGLFLGPVILALVIALIRFTLEMRHAQAIDRMEAEGLPPAGGR